MVVPFLSSNKELYGLYTFCASFQLYLSYADIGFLSAGQKYAAECYAKEDREGEVKIFGFVGFILLCLILPFSIIMCVAAYNPNIVVKGLSPENINIVRGLLIVIAVVSPTQVLLQRVTQSILTIRVKDYVSSRIDVIGNVIKIVSVFWFFTGGRYMIFEYFLFINVVTITCSFITILIIRKIEKYSFRELLKSVKWSGVIFQKMKLLAFSSLGATLSWLICYELDLILIGNLFTVVDVAHYSICLSVLNFIRNISNILYGPYSQRFNHFVALKDEASLKRMLHILIKNTYPLYIFGCCLLSSVAYYFVLLWVGVDYIPSVPLLSVLIFFFILQFIKHPAEYLVTAKEKYSMINFMSIASPVIFLSLIFILRAIGMGVMSFVIAKVAVAVVIGIYLAVYMSKQINLWTSFKEYLVPVIATTIAICFIMVKILPSIFPNPDKSSTGLAVLLLVCALGFAIYAVIVYGMNKNTRQFVLNKVREWKK